jgi:hypothetical protein
MADDPEQRTEALAELLCHAYEYGGGLEEQQAEDPQRAQEHQGAAAFLLSKLEQAPFNEKRAAFRRGYDRGTENAKKAAAEHTAQLEAALAELRQDRDPDRLRARIADLEYVVHGYGRLHKPGTDLRGQLADALARLQAAQRELAELRGVQPSDATGERPSA